MEMPVNGFDARVATLADGRRGFLERVAAMAVGALVVLVPGAASLTVLLDPLRKRQRSDGLVKVAPLEMVPADGIPRRFPIVASREDAWNRLPEQPVGAVYLRREPGADSVEVLNAACPHAGCMVRFQEEAGCFRCPCHDSRFERSGARIDPSSCPSPRDLDTLKAEVREERDPEDRPLTGPDGTARRGIWVQYRSFRAGTPAKVVVE